MVQPQASSRRMAEVPIARAFCQTASMTSSLNGFPETSLLGRRCITSTFSRARKCLLFRQCFATQSEDVFGRCRHSSASESGWMHCTLHSFYWTVVVVRFSTHEISVNL